MKPIREFEKQYRNFEHEGTVVASYVYAEMSLQHAASRSKTLLSALNRTPSFWRTAFAAFQSAAYIALGRIFDQKSPYNIEQLLLAIEADMGSFTPAGLKARRIADGYVEVSRLDEYVADKHTLTAGDVRSMRRAVARWRLVYDRAIMPVRHQYLAHRQAQGAEPSNFTQGGRSRKCG